MIFLDGRRAEYWRRVFAYLGEHKDAKVLDVACGFGKFAHLFKPENYMGIDFSEEMIKLAKEKNPGYAFFVMDYKDDILRDQFDLVFEINSLRSLGLNYYDFIERSRELINDGGAIFIGECDEWITYRKQKY